MECGSSGRRPPRGRPESCMTSGRCTRAAGRAAGGARCRPIRATLPGCRAACAAWHGWPRGSDGGAQTRCEIGGRPMTSHATPSQSHAVTSRELYSAVYGTVLASALLAALQRDGDQYTPYYDAVWVLVTATTAALAHGYA